MRDLSEPELVKAVDRLVDAAFEFNELGVQVEYTKRMIEVSVWFLIFQIGWLLAAAVGPWGGVSLALIGPRVQLSRLVIAQLGKRLLINVGLFGALLGGMDLAVQASQSRRDGLDVAQLGMSAGTGALMGVFLTAFTGFFPTRSMWGLMGRSGLASGASTLTPMVFSDQPVDWEMVLKGVTSGVLGGADAHWASWSPGGRVPGGEGPMSGLGGERDAGLTGLPDSTPTGDGGTGQTAVRAGMDAADLKDPVLSAAQKAQELDGGDTYVPSSGRDGRDGGSVGLPERAPGPAAHRDGVPVEEGSARGRMDAADLKDPVRPAAERALGLDGGGETTTSLGAVPEQGAHPTLKGARDPVTAPGLDVDSLINQANPGSVATKLTDGPASPSPASPSAAALPPPVVGKDPQASSPFQILADRGRSGDGYASPGLWGKYGAAGVLIKHVDANGIPRFLLVQRGPEVSSNAGKWQLPGGALDSKESAPQGVARELREELGVGQEYLNTLEFTGTHVAEGPNGWTYTNIAAEGDAFTPRVDGGETSAARWLTLGELAIMANREQLHPALAESLGDVLSLFDTGARAGDEAVATRPPGHPSPVDVPAASPDGEPVVSAGPYAGGVHETGAPATIPEIPRMEGYTQTGGQGGFNEGGRYMDPSGKEWYIKAPKTDVHAMNEVLVMELYREAGVFVPVVELIYLNGDLGEGNLGVRSGIVEGVQDLATHLDDPAYLKDLYGDFAVDAWVANWDTIGRAYDNILNTPDGKMRIDGGGGLLFRARGEPKGERFAGLVGEIDSLRYSHRNPQARAVFQHVTDADIRTGVQKVARVSEHRIDELVDNKGFPAEEAAYLKATLKARRLDLMERFGVQEDSHGGVNHSDGTTDPAGSRSPTEVTPDAEPLPAGPTGETRQPGPETPLVTPETAHTAPARSAPLAEPIGARLVSPSFGDAIWRPVIDDLPAPLRRALWMYSQNGFTRINGLLRDPEYFLTEREYLSRLPEGRALIRAHTEKNINLINEATRLRPVPEMIDVLRWIDLAGDPFTVPVEDLPGTVQRAKGFQSTYLGEERPTSASRPALLHLRLPEGTPAIYLEPLVSSREFELLLGSGLPWLAEDVVKQGDHWRIYAQMLPEDFDG
ncbi:hypothetical protein GCM10012289_55520 [Nonomuraea cavernae]|uniref:Nudix hydrolase domain-containing protein n=1 Tax=Nonomuraea cavernae TaxID=2045107 RepID=A0A918DPV0_9ACTN|nr:hypothetical protein GCM10012289_55520 [Nonomuraea cavernae]